LIKSAGGIEALADRIKFKYGSLMIEDLNKLLYKTTTQSKSMKDISKKRRLNSNTKDFTMTPERYII